MTYKTLSAVAAVAIMAASTSQAATFDASSFLGSDNHSIWISGGLSSNSSNQFGGSQGDNFDFLPGATFDTDYAWNGNAGEATATTGTLLGKAESKVAGSGFDVNFSYDVDFGSATPGYKAESGNSTVPDDNAFLNLAGGFLSGYGLLDGLVLSVTARPANIAYATQIGTGSNAKNKDKFGMANWFFIDVVEYDCSVCNGTFKTFSQLDSGNGDVNILLNGGVTPAPVPLPAGGLLILSALAGMGAMRARRKAA